MSRIECYDATCLADEGIGRCTRCKVAVCITHAWTKRCPSGTRHDTSGEVCRTRLLSPAQHAAKREARLRGIAAARVAIRERRARRAAAAWEAHRRVSDVAVKLRVSRRVALGLLDLAGVEHGELVSQQKQDLVELLAGGAMLTEAAVAVGLSARVARATAASCGLAT